MRISLLLISLLLLQTTVSTKPGFRFEVTQKGVDYARVKLVHILEKAIKDAKTFPHLSVRVWTPIGPLNVTVWAQINHVYMPHSDANIAPPSSVDLRISDAIITLAGVWEFREEIWPHLVDYGTIDMKVSGVNIGLTVDVGMNDEGKPHVTSRGCSFREDKIKVDFHGKMSDIYFYNMFNHATASAVKAALNDQLCPLISKELNGDINSILSSLDLTTNIDSHCYIDYTLTEPPFVDGDAFFVNGKGEIFNRQAPEECPSPKQELPATVNEDRMVSLWVTEYMLNTAGFAYQTAGMLQYNLTSQDIPSKVPITMDTGFFKSFIPPLYEAYPDRELTLWIRVTEPVTFEVATDGVSGKAEGVIEWLVNMEDGSYESAFTLDAQVDLCVNISVQLGSSSALYLDIISVQPYIQLHSSNIGNFSIDPLQNFLTFSRALIVPFVNGLLNNGIPLPSFKDIAFSGFDFTLKEGYIQIHTDIEYTPGRRVMPVNYTLFNAGQFSCRSRDQTRDFWLYGVMDSINSYLVLPFIQEGN